MYPEYDVLVVNDGSRDKTAEAARAAGALVVSHAIQHGLWCCHPDRLQIRFGQRLRFLVQIDGDGQHDPAFIPKVLAPVLAGETDFAIGSRFLEGESYAPSLARRLGMTFFRWLVSTLIGMRITDSTSGYQAFNRKVIRYFTTEVFPCDYPMPTCFSLFTGPASGSAKCRSGCTPTPGEVDACRLETPLLHI